MIQMNISEIKEQFIQKEKKIAIFISHYYLLDISRINDGKNYQKDLIDLLVIIDRKILIKKV